jgi:hypothetical protein
MAFLPGKFEDGSLSKKSLPVIWEKLFPTNVAPPPRAGKIGISDPAGQGAAGRGCACLGEIMKLIQCVKKERPDPAFGAARVGRASVAPIWRGRGAFGAPTASGGLGGEASPG